MIFYYHGIVILSVILSSVFLLRWRRDISVHFPMIFLMIPIINLGYLKVATAETVTEALLANGIGYLDGCFLELIFFLYIMSFCKLKVPKVITAGMLMVGTLIFFFSINTAQNHLLYKSAELRNYEGVSYLVKEYGPVHTVYYFVIALYLIANLSAIIYSFTRRNVSKINSLLLLIIYLLIIFAFVAGKSFGQTVELLPLSYLFSQVIFLIVMSKITLYDTASSTMLNITEQGDIGFATFDRKRRYLGCTDGALAPLPELNEIYIDKTLTADNEVFAKILECIDKVDAGSETAFFNVSRNDISYKVTLGHLYSGNKIKGYLIRTEDNTEESRRLEALELREKQKEMEAKMLRLEKSAAEAANEAKSAFLAQMSHEIRTPINAVLGMNEMVMRESSEPNIREYAANIQSSGKTLLSLINSILDLSKIENGKMEIIPAEYQTGLMINDIVGSIAPKAAQKGLELDTEIDSTLPRSLLGDDLRIRQIILNLLSNAVKYTDSGSVTLIIKGQKNDDDKHILLCVSVKDTGIGIKQEDMDVLFESFKRLDEQHNRNIEGTGLGMPIVTKLLELMGSRLEVQSVYGEGSVFGFELVQEIADSEPMGDYTEYISDIGLADESEYLYAPDAKILVVDDNEMNLKVAKSLLRLYGIDADTASSGKAALEMLERRRYDVILLDQMMPEMNGIEVLGQIREKKLTDSGTAIIALTANAIVGAKEMYLSAGFDDYITKPIESKTLESHLRRFLPADKQLIKEQPAAVLQSENAETLSYEEIVHIREVCPELNAAQGMKYCMDQKQFWYEMLAEFADQDSLSKLQAAFETNDTESYRITVHSIKSSAKSIGAELLSEKARLLEFAAKDADTDYIRANHGEFVSQYKALTEGIRQLAV